jgi:glycosyltransferase involved in cell wall biosynthesis
MYGFLSKHYIKKGDIFHVRCGSGLGGAIEKAKKCKMKVVVDYSAVHPTFAHKQLKDEYDRNEKILDMGIEVPFWRAIWQDCEKADCLLVNSNFVKDTCIEYGYAPEHIKVIYLGVRKDFWNLKQIYNIKSRVQILFTGNFSLLKGAEYILKAMQELDKKGFPYQMKVVGSYAGSESLIEKYKPSSIHFAGFVVQDGLKKYLAESDIYLFPSLCDGCASSGMEAMAAGFPVIATKESGLPIQHNENGIIVPSKNVDAIVDAITLLAGDEKLCQKIGTAAAKTIADNYTWEKYAEKVKELYEELLENRCS